VEPNKKKCKRANITSGSNTKFPQFSLLKTYLKLFGTKNRQHSALLMFRKLKCSIYLQSQTSQKDTYLQTCIFNQIKKSDKQNNHKM